MGERKPIGITMLLIDDRGNVTATASDFKTDKPAGFDLKSAQERRCKDNLAHAAADTYCSPIYTQGMNHYWKQKTLSNLRDHHGFKIHIEYVGHDTENAND